MKVVSIDLTAGQEEVIYEYDDSNGFFINELCATSEFLFWFNNFSTGRSLE